MQFEKLTEKRELQWLLLLNFFLDIMDAAYYSEISLPVNHIRLVGELCMPPRAKALIIFSQNSGSNRFNGHNRQVAAYLQDRNFGTLLFDLLTPDEFQKKIDIDLLTKRLIEVTQFIESLSGTKHIPIGYYGGSIGAAAALKAALKQPQIFCVVAKAGRLDLVDADLEKVNTPVLLIVGAFDAKALGLNQAAFQKLQCEKKLEIVARASHTFEELGVMEKVAELATAWFKSYLPVKITI